MPMEAILKEINGVIGVTGSFVCLNDASIAAQAVPASFDAAGVALAARIANQTFQALETSGQRIAEADLSFDQARVVLKNLRVGVLVILCARTINLPLLNLTANAAIRKLTEELKPVKASVKVPAAAPPASEPVPAILPTPTVSAPIHPLFVELESEWQQIMSAAAKSQTTLRVMSSLATWVCCPHTRTLLTPPEKKHLDFAARASQRNAIRRGLESLGYQTGQSFDEFRNSPRLFFTNPARGVSAEIYLDTFTMYHQLDLTPFLAQEGATLAETALLLLRLQFVEIPEPGLRELNALLRDHDLSPQAEPGKIDLTQITRLCADHWSWYKTVTMNLQRVMAFAVQFIPPDDKTIIVERAAQIARAIEDAPKSLRWQTRARLGESIRWYDLPVASTPEQRTVEIRYGD
jgi:predicted regulator of Ras-like GTPase activity (Roadblock/LC7/MglB family)